MHDVTKDTLSQIAPASILARQALQESALLWDSMLDGLPIGVYTCDCNGRLVHYNRKAAELWGRSPHPASAAHQYCSAHKSFRLNGEALALNDAPMSEALRTRAPVRDREVVVERPDGSRITVLANVDPLFDVDGELLGGVNCFQDITELRQVTRDLEDFFENGAMALHLVGPDGTILRANKAELEMLGYAHDEYVGRNISEFHADQHVIDEILSRLSNGQKLDKYPARLRTKDGGLRNVLITSNAQFRDGQFINTRCFTLDVTDWTRAQEQLREQDQRLAATYEHAAIGIAETDETGRHLRVNEALCSMAGYSREEMLSRTFFDNTHPDDIEPDRSLYAQQMAGELSRYHVEKRYLRKDGAVAWVSVNSVLVRQGDGSPRYAVRVIQDVTRQKRAEEALRQGERQFRDLLEALPAAVYTTDPQGHITFYNQAAVDMAGRRPELGTDEWCVTWKLYWPDGTPLPHDECPMAIALKESRPVRGVEAVAERPDGTRVPFIPFPTPLRDSSGALVGAVNMLVDISERKQSESNQRILLDELNHRVKNNMQMLHSLLRAAQRETDSHEAQAVLAEAGQRIGAMAAAHKALYEAGNTVTYNAKDFLDSVCTSARQTFGDAVEISVAEFTAEKLPNDTAMPLALILNELLTNAVKHGINGRGRGSIRVGLTKNAESFILYVEDDGPGFELEEARKRSSGLGLVAGLARQLGGIFNVERASGARCIVRFKEHQTVH